MVDLLAIFLICSQEKIVAVTEIRTFLKSVCILVIQKLADGQLSLNNRF